MNIHKKRGVLIEKTYDRSDFIVIEGMFCTNHGLLMKKIKGFFVYFNDGNVKINKYMDFIEEWILL